MKLIFLLMFPLVLEGQGLKENLNNAVSVSVSVSTDIMILMDLDKSDTTEVIYVLLKEDYMEQINGYHLIDSIPFPYLEVVYGFHIQHRKPYRVEFLDSDWNLINEDDLLYIKKRKLFKQTNK